MGRAPGGLEVRERRVPARPLDDVRGKRRSADGLHRIVGVVEQREPRLAGGLEEGDVEGSGLRRVGGQHSERVSCTPQVGSEDHVAPFLSPLVVVGGRADHRHAGVVCRAAADHARAERAVVLAARAPVVRERERARIEEIVRPRARRARAVVGPGLDQADAALRDPRTAAPRRRTRRCRHRRPPRRTPRPEHTTPRSSAYGRPYARAGCGGLRSRGGSTRHALSEDESLVRARVRGADTRARAGLAGDRGRRPRPRPGADRVGEDTGGVPPRARPAQRRRRATA